MTYPLPHDLTCSHFQPLIDFMYPCQLLIRFNPRGIDRRLVDPQNGRLCVLKKEISAWKIIKAWQILNQEGIGHFVKT